VRTGGKALRANLEHFVEADEAKDLYPIDHGALGGLYDLHGVLSQFFGDDGCQMVCSPMRELVFFHSFFSYGAGRVLTVFVSQVFGID